jgi:hypothetical protein
MIQHCLACLEGHASKDCNHCQCSSVERASLSQAPKVGVRSEPPRRRQPGRRRAVRVRVRPRANDRTDRTDPLTGGGLPPVAGLLAWSPTLLPHIWTWSRMLSGCSPSICHGHSGCDGLPSTPLAPPFCWPLQTVTVSTELESVTPILSSSVS